MPLALVRPPALRPGDTIGIIAPAGPIRDRDMLTRGAAALERLGFRVRFNERIFDATRYLAGDDEARARELVRSFEDPEIRAVLPARGGFGCSRLLPHLDWDRLALSCKVFTGFSDLTTLHLFFRRRGSWVTFHGPMACSPALASVTGKAEEHLLSLWSDPSYKPRLSFPQLECWKAGKAEGPLIGGCLSLITASLGTTYEIVTDGCILFLEDLGEAPYRIDRMLTQLRLAGKLDGVAGIILGGFEQCDPPEEGYTCGEILREILDPLGVPVLANFPAGHGTENWALPFGIPARMDADALRIELLESAVQ